MKHRIMHGTLLGAIALAAMPVTAQSWGPDATSFSAQARVVSALPIRETAASAPRQECWTEYSEGSGGNQAAGAVIGGIAGGLIGHQIGQRSRQHRGNDRGRARRRSGRQRGWAPQQRSARDRTLPHRIRYFGSRCRLRRRLPFPGSRVHGTPAVRPGSGPAGQCDGNAESISEVIGKPRRGRFDPAALFSSISGPAKATAASYGFRDLDTRVARPGPDPARSVEHDRHVRVVRVHRAVRRADVLHVIIQYGFSANCISRRSFAHSTTCASRRREARLHGCRCPARRAYRPTSIPSSASSLPARFLVDRARVDSFCSISVACSA